MLIKSRELSKSKFTFLLLSQFFFTFLSLFMLKWGPWQPCTEPLSDIDALRHPSFLIKALLSDCLIALFARSNTGAGGQVEHEYLAVANLACSCAVNDCF